jgi:hypothetical protein
MHTFLISSDKCFPGLFFLMKHTHGLIFFILLHVMNVLTCFNSFELDRSRLLSSDEEHQSACLCYMEKALTLFSLSILK